ncbi:MAG: SIMPL domain-containing protein, partial [Solimonas sp.]
MKTLPYALLCLSLLAAPVVHADQAQRRSVNVSGQGEVSVRPDRAQLHVAVDAVNADPKAAEAEVNQVVRAYV